MLIYNHEKEFVGISEDGLKLLGCATLNELLSECYDVADLFVKRPGYIHNFKNFNWIDFIQHAEAEESKAIVYIKGKIFSCNLSIKHFYLTGTPDTHGYEIHMNHVQMITGDQAANIAQEVSNSPRSPSDMVMPVASSASLSQSHVPTEEESDFDSTLPNFDDVESTDLQEPDPLDVPEPSETAEAVYDPYAATQDEDTTVADPYAPVDNNEFESEEGIDFSKPLEIDDDIFTVSQDDDSFHKDFETDLFNDLDEAKPQSVAKESSNEFEDTVSEQNEINEPAPMLGDYTHSDSDKQYLDNLQVDSNYVYDPHVAADELGLPVDLIEEFIGDFIQQAHDFRDELYESVAKEDLDNVKILSHKLKGVAANLRIEDAFEVLAIINTSNEIPEIEANLHQLDRIVAKLEGKDPDVVETTGSMATEEAVPTQSKESLAPELDKEAETEEDTLELLSQTEAVELEPNVVLKDDEHVALPPMPSLDEEDDLYNLEPLANVEELDNAVIPEESFKDDDLYDLDKLQELSQEQEDELSTPPSALEDDDDLYAALPTDNAQQDTTEAETENDTTQDDDDDDLYNIGLKQDEDSPLIVTDLPSEHEENKTAEKTQIEEPSVHEAQSSELTLSYNLENTSNELGLDSALVSTLVNDFKKQLEESHNVFDDAVAQGDSQQWQAEALLYKGVSDNLRIAEISSVLETLIHTKDAGVAQTEVNKLYQFSKQL